MRSAVTSAGLSRVLLAVAVCLASHGCADITVRRANAPDLLDAWKESAALGDEPSPRTRQTLRRFDLDKVYRSDPDEAARRLHAAALADPQPDTLFALAEIYYHRGRQVEKWSAPDALAYYYFCAGYSYHFIFDYLDAKGDTPGGFAIFDPRFRLACDLYNAGLSKCVRAAQQAGRLDPCQLLRLAAGDHTDFTLSVVQHGFAWKPEEFGKLEFAEDFEVTGLANQYHNYGLGVPLIGNRAPATGTVADYVPQEARFPVTAFFRFEGSLADLGARRAGRLELYNPLKFDALEVRGHTVPLETDLTTPLAYYLSKSGLNGLEYKLFLNPDNIGDRAGIRMLEPYQPGKIPVLLVHGLLSSPLTWAPALNDLRGDPALRDRYQFWTYFYPTSQPYVVTAADLRRELARLRKDIDPQHQDRALDDMVLVSHSMGGLVSKLLTVNSGQDFRKLVSDKPLDQLTLKPEERGELERVVYFEPEPEIRRVVFIATPHGGSQISPSPLGRLADRLAGLPGRAAATLHEVVRENPELSRIMATATSIDELAPESPVLAALAGKQPPPGVHYHSIIGVTEESANVVEEWITGVDAHVPGDGVVPYKSAHLEGADSEVVVPADHTHVHHHPLAILELRRILLEHARTADDKVTR